LEEYRPSLAPCTMEFAAERCEVPLETLIRVAEEIGKAETMCVIWAMGITQRSMGSDSSTAISNLLLVTGNYMKPNCGAYPLRGHNNVQGAGDMGFMPNRFPGYQFIADEEVRHKFERAWGYRCRRRRIWTAHR
jgi:formate dehydrogenase major subunit